MADCPVIATPSSSRFHWREAVVSQVDSIPAALRQQNNVNPFLRLNHPRAIESSFLAPRTAENIIDLR